MNRAIGIFAHPDDEAIIVGGTFRLLADLGWETHLICATKGEASTAYDRSYVRKEDLGVVREKEILDAAGILGVSQVHFMNYMDGTLADQEDETAMAWLADKLNTLQPELIYTFEVNGISFHPDHKTIHRWVIQLLKDKKLNYEPRGIYLATIDNSSGRLRKGLLMGSHINDITTIIPIDAVAEIKAKAILAHRTQLKMLLENGLIVDGALQRNNRNEHFIHIDSSGAPIEVEDKERTLLKPCCDTI
jgi:LmbE family N-acetylglucosaminyl deacetylase